MKLHSLALGVAMALSVCSTHALAHNHTQQSEQTQNSNRIAPVAEPTEQYVMLNLDADKDTFSGYTSIKLTVIKATNTLEVNGLDYSITKAQLVGEHSCDLNASMHENGKVSLRCEQTIFPGHYELKLGFDAPYNRKSVGLYKTTDAGLNYLFTQFEMSDARRAFPVFDEPSYKIPFQLSIAAPQAQKVFANTPLLKTETRGDLVVHHFAQTPPIPSYLVAMAVGPFEEMQVDNLGVPGRIITPQGKIALGEYAKDVMPDILQALEDYFGIDYVYKKLDSVAVPEFPFGAMENAGLVTYREDILLLDPNTATQGQKERSASIIAHELAHQWYGNLVTMKWWNDLWLNEAFASWMAAKVTAELYPEFESDLNLPQNNVMGLDARLSTKPIRKPVHSEADIMDGLGLAYSKGSAVLSMIENWIGKDAFQKGMRSYMKKYAYKNAEADDLWSELSQASGKDVSAVLKSFVEQSSYPLISAQVNGSTLSLTQQRFVNAGVKAPEQLWSVPVTIKYGKGDKVATTQVLLNKANQDVKLDFAPSWIYPDANAMGYYRWTLSDAQLSSLLEHAPNVLSTRERLALIAASNALLDAGTLNGAQTLNILGEFVGDAHPSVASAALSALSQRMASFEDKTNEQLWPTFIRNSLQGAIKQYGLTAKEGEKANISQLRTYVVSLLGFEGKDQQTINTAQKQAKSYLKDPASVDPYLAQTYLSLASYHGDEALLKAYKKVFESTKAPQVRTQLLAAMGYFGAEKLQQQVLDYLLSDALTASDMRYIIGGLRYTDERAARFSTWVYANYDALSNKLPPFSVPNLPAYVASGCEKAPLDKAQGFFGDKVEQVPGYSRTLAKVEESVNQCIALKARELDAVNAFLKKAQ